MGKDQEDSMQARYARATERIFGALVRQLRKDRGMSQEELAQYLSVGGRSYHQTTIAKLENGTRPTSVGEVALLAAILGVEASELFVPNQQAAILGVGVSELLPTEQIEAWRKFIYLQTEGRRVAQQLAAATEQQQQLQAAYEQWQRHHDAYLEAARTLNIELPEIELPEQENTGEADDDGEH